MQCLYKTLDLLPTATDNEIRSAYRRCALSTHPDKGGSAEAFRSVVHAFEILVDASRRAAYDQLLRCRSKSSSTAPEKKAPPRNKRKAESSTSTAKPAVAKDKPKRAPAKDARAPKESPKQHKSQPPQNTDEFKHGLQSNGSPRTLPPTASFAKETGIGRVGETVRGGFECLRTVLGITGS